MQTVTNVANVNVAAFAHLDRVKMPALNNF